MAAHFVLLAPTFPLPQGRFLLPKGVHVLGRSTKCDLVLNDTTISRRHARLNVGDSSVLVTDLESHNGTFIENQRVDHGTLRPGQRIRFGSIDLFLCGADQELPSSGHSMDDTASADSEEMRVASDPRLRDLTPAQRRVFYHLVNGLAEKRIATKVELSQHTVHNHIRAIYKVFGVHSRAELLASLLPAG
jgi:pSer/pThr/pTyr-binding forkhead associated (FHA) protein